MKFGVQFEFHKIPEWYQDYLDYNRFNQMVKRFKQSVKDGHHHKVSGLYYLTQSKKVVKLQLSGATDQQDDENQTLALEEDSHAFQQQEIPHEIPQGSLSNADQLEMKKLSKWVDSVAIDKRSSSSVWKRQSKKNNSKLRETADFKSFSSAPNEEVNQEKTLFPFNLPVTLDDKHLHKYLYEQEETFQQRHLTEGLISSWVAQFLVDIERIETFYNHMAAQLKGDYDDLKEKMLQKQSDDEPKPVAAVNFSQSPSISGELPQNLDVQKSPIAGRKMAKKTVEGQKITKVKDELEYATNWRRAFNRIFTYFNAQIFTWQKSLKYDAQDSCN